MNILGRTAVAILEFHGRRKKSEAALQAPKRIGSQTSNVGTEAPTHKTDSQCRDLQSPIHNAAVASRTAKIGCAPKPKA
jgi:hypothetical protein